MDIRFRLPDTPDDTNVGQLYDWLRRDRALRISSKISLLPAEPEPGDMGGALDAVQLVLDSGFQLASLAVAIVAWRQACEPRSAVTITRGDVEVRLRGAELDDVQAVLDALESLREAEDSPETGGGNGDGDAPEGGR